MTPLVLVTLITTSFVNFFEEFITKTTVCMSVSQSHYPKLVIQYQRAAKTGLILSAREINCLLTFWVYDNFVQSITL